jgi:hypothetical protein
MKTIFKLAGAAVLTGAIALAVATPSEARNGRNAAAIGGFAVGAIVGAAAANAANRNYYGGPGYYDSGYAYGPGYVAEPSYAYEPEPVYVAPSYRYRNNYRPPCAVDMGYGKLDYSSC